MSPIVEKPFSLVQTWWPILVVVGAFVYGYGQLSWRVGVLEGSATDRIQLIEKITTVTVRLESLEKEMERLRIALERGSQTRATVP